MMENFSFSKKYLVVGHISKDIIITNEEKEESFGGTVIYGAFSALKYGWRSFVLSKVNAHDFGNCIDYLAKNNVNTSFVLKTLEPTTSFELVYSRDSRKLFLKNVCDSILPKDIKAFRDLSLSFEIVHIGSIYHEVLPETIDIISKFSKKIVIDIQGYIRKRRRNGEITLYPFKSIYEVLKRGDIIHLEENEAYAVTAIKDPILAGIKILRKTGKIVLVTRGEKGSLVFSGEKVLKVPAFNVEIKDPTGAGDVYTTIFSLSYYETLNLKYSAAMASSASSYLVEKYGPEGFETKDKIEQRAKKILPRIKERQIRSYLPI